MIIRHEEEQRKKQREKGKAISDIRNREYCKYCIHAPIRCCPMASLHKDRKERKEAVTKFTGRFPLSVVLVWLLYMMCTVTYENF